MLLLGLVSLWTLGAQEEAEEVLRLVPLEAEFTLEERLLLAVS